MAQYAMRDAAADLVVSGIITLATPFVSARRRRFRPYISALSFLLVAAPVVTGALLLALEARRAGLVSPAEIPRPMLLTWVLPGAALIATTDRPPSECLIGLVCRRQSEILG